ncbi:MAG: 4'-phosphopantetheinyl transferase superfamily protein [Verrucomicrobia bacterium]|nr:4'-phosphopantetheinyl transferase superfamily protein [Verrucomicrobiota bacterium]
MEFNISHSQEVVLLAFARSLAVGVDVEWLGRTADHAEVDARFFSEQEQRQLNALPVEDRPRAFLQCWTRKEAYLKARGFGLSRDPRTFSVLITGDVGAVLLEDHDDPTALNSWSIHPIHLEWPSDYCAAVASSAPCGAWRYRCVQWIGFGSWK